MLKFTELISVIIIFVGIFVITSLVSADTDTNNNTNDTIRFSIKSKFLERDENFNTEIVRINITIDRLGKLTYIENYYLQGFDSLKLQSSNKYFDAVLTKKSISFNIARPRPGTISKRKYVFVESIILFDNKVIFNRTLNLSNRNRLDYNNMPPVKKSNATIKKSTSKTSKSPANITEKKDAETDTEVDTEMDIEIDTGTNETTTSPEKTYGFEIIIATVAISILYILRPRNKWDVLTENYLW